MRIFLILFFAFTAANAQVGLQTFQPVRSAKVEAGYQYWSADSDQIQQFSIPFTLNWTVNENLKLDVTSSPSFNSFVSQSTLELGGPSDTRVRGAWLFDNEAMMLTFGINLPTGKSSLTVDEFRVAALLANHAFNFRSPILGQGLDISAGFSMVQEWQDFLFGYGAGFLLRGAYKPYADYDYDYNPGEEFSISGGVDYYTGRNSKLMLDLSYTFFGNDMANDVAVFKSGNRLSIMALWSFEQEFVSWLLMVRDRIQSKNQAGTVNLVPERLNNNGNEFDLTGMAFLKWRPGTRLHGLVDFKVYSDNANDLGGVTLMGIGGGANQSLSPSILLDVELRYYFGSINSGVENVGLSGFQFSSGLKLYL